LTFEVGNFERGNRFIRNLGYYWAASDYWDLESGIDFYENEKNDRQQQDAIRAEIQNAGSVGASYSREAQWNRSTFLQRIGNRWRFNIGHNQTISNSIGLTASGTFLSDKKLYSR